MQSTSRIVATLLAGVGIALIVAGLVAPRFLIGDGRLPLGLENTTWTLKDTDGSYLGEPAPVTRQLHMEVQNPADAETASVRIGDTLRAGDAGSDFDNLVTATTWTYALDRTSGEPVGDMRLQTVMGMPETTVSGAGHWLKFPTNVQQQTYEVFDPVLRATAPAEFAGEGTLGGREVYTFTQTIPPTNVALTYADMRNTMTLQGPDDEPIRAFYFHSAERELTVDQVSGLVVDISESVDDFYGDAQARRLQDIVAYDATMDPAQAAALAQQLGTVFSMAQSRALTLGVIGLGSVLTLAGALGALGVFNRSRRAQSGEPTRAHRRQGSARA
ncbi:DUF3068 domain-containing protein [Corynebacterium sp.]|uniref:DUF3068 domain-containing protein n=1 Tax=Corynebacterium sp. TaxID=1720 RepID=UPI002A90B907|nr:DUF3068 domain-containing protein [Corynebacterium sp.]MDY5785827.1 DUF3068 domain-containing protein [Corynebacterium sp.]